MLKQGYSLPPRADILPLLYYNICKMGGVKHYFLFIAYAGYVFVIRYNIELYFAHSSHFFMG